MVQAVSRRGRTKPRILYWFRTPPGIRIGRTSLDSEAVRLIEASHPHLQFDWSRILKGRPDPEAAEAKAETSGAQPPRAARRTGLRDTGASPELAAARSGGVSTAAPGPAAARLGPEGLRRLRNRYRQIMARIVQVGEDRRAELKRLAERLNPDAWQSDEAVRKGLDAYEESFEALRTSLDELVRQHEQPPEPSASEAALE